MDFRERIERNRTSNIKVITANSEQQEAQNEAVLDFNYYAVESVRKVPACIDLCFANGSRKAIPYSYVMRINFEAGSEIEIITAGGLIKIVGRELVKLYDYLTMFRVKYIRENIGMDVAEPGLFVKCISFEESRI